MNRVDEQVPFHFHYDVFLSFRGKDTRRNFTQSLYDALHSQGIRTFIDSVDIQRGCEITPSLLGAILDSAMAVVVISSNYANSRWCLEELAKIIDCGRLILPVFYGVNPRDVRVQKGPFEDDFRSHEKLFGDGSEQVLRWRKAFEKVGEIAGWVSNDWEEAKLIQNLVGVILTKLGNTPLLATKPTSPPILPFVDRAVRSQSLLLERNSMTPTEETAPAVEQPVVADPPPAEPEEVKSEAKPAKEPKAKKPRKPRTPSAHPPYLEMIKEAILALKERTGSSQYAITKFIEDKHKAHLPPNFKKLVLVQFRKLTASGKLVKVKNSYKLPSSSVAKKPAAVAKPKSKVAAAKPKPKPKAAAAVKPKKKAVVKPKAKPVAKAAKALVKPKAKPVKKVKPAPAKAKPVAKAKAKAVAKTKPAAKPAKASRTSTRTSPGKKVAAPPAKAVAVTKKKAAPAKTVKAKAKVVKKSPAKSVKPKAKAKPTRKAPSRK